LDTGIGIYNGYYQVTPISISIEIFMFLIGALILMPWYPSHNRFIINIKNIRSSYLTELKNKTSSPLLSEYSLILLFTILGGSLLISSSDLISMYLSIELQSFAVYILTSLNRNSETSTSAGLKYFLLGGLSSCLILLGCALVYSYTGITNLDSIYSLVSVPSVLLTDLSFSDDFGGVIDPLVNVSGVSMRGFLLGIVLIFIGFLFKIAGAPFHNWAPDVYDDSSTIVTTWLTIMPKISIIIFLLELESGLFLPLASSLSSIHLESDLTSLLQIVKDIYSVGPIQFKGEQSLNVIKSLLLFSSLLSLIIGTVVGLAQYKIKRLLAYSTISHVGFLLLALGINTEQSIESLIFYILQYSITNLNTFLILLVFGYTFNTLLDQSNTPLTINNQALYSLYNKEYKSSSPMIKEDDKEQGRVGEIKMHTIESNDKDIKYISQLKAQFIYNPILSISLAICLFSMAGIKKIKNAEAWSNKIHFML
jgi:NADH-ubiquinone oxidoreductase chain 2